MANTVSYTPGVCNIGRAEIQTRRRMGWAATAVTVALLLVIALWGGAPTWLRWVVFVPAAGAAQGLLQATLGFCTGYGMRGVFNVGDQVGQTETIVDPQALAADRRKALLITLASAAIGLVAVGLAWLL